MGAQTTIQVDKKSMDMILKRLHEMSNASDPKESSPMTKALRKSALRLETNIKKSPNMPVDTGRLRSSFHAKFRPSEVYMYTIKSGETFNGSLKEVIKENQEVIVGSNVEYGPLQNHIKRFMIDGYNTTLPEIKKYIGDAFKVIFKGGKGI